MKPYKILIFITLPLLMACTGPAKEPAFEIDCRHVMDMARDMACTSDSVLYADQWFAAATAGDTCALWLHTHGVISSADTLLSFLLTAPHEGLSPHLFKAAELRERIDSVRAWHDSGRFSLLSDTLAAEIEAQLTISLLRYSYGQRYGYVSAEALLNRLLPDYDSPRTTDRPYRRLFGIACQHPSDSLAAHAIHCVRRDSIGDFLRSVQPDSRLHRLLALDYQRAAEGGDTARAVKALVNLERSRWCYPKPDTGTYVLVNLAAQRLWAVDCRRDTCIDMRICCGNLTHKSPLLTSRISYIELDPYWTVPMSIRRNEIARLHLGDSAYFARNRMMVINNETKAHINPASLSASDWCSMRYTLRQDRGAGNSLGRMVFRFPNDFAVYLHDTNSPGAFSREMRTVSHGCIRVQRPMDLAEFLIAPEVTPLYIDRIRMSIDLPPLTDEGRALLDKDPKPLKRYDLKSPVPLWIDYYTLYPSLQDSICEYPDIYSYDGVIADALRPYCLMPKP